MSGRVNNAMCKTQRELDDDPETIRRAADWNVVDIVDLLFSCCPDWLPSSVYDKMRKFSQEMGRIFDPLKVFKRDANPTANEMIMTRLIEFGAPGLEQD